MESHQELLEKVLALSLSNSQLREEVGRLDSYREFLEHQFTLNKISLNSTIEVLPGVLEILVLKKPPVSTAYSYGSKGCLLSFDLPAFPQQPHRGNIEVDVLRSDIWKMEYTYAGLAPCAGLEHT